MTSFLPPVFYIYTLTYSQLYGVFFMCLNSFKDFGSTFSLSYRRRMNSFIFPFFLLLLFRSLIDLDDWLGQNYINFLFYHCFFFTGYSTGNFCLSDDWHRLRPDLIRARSYPFFYLFFIIFSHSFYENNINNKTNCAALVNRELILDTCF